MKSETQLKHAITAHSNTVKRICFMYLHNVQDVEDIFQNVFTKYILSLVIFKNEEHEKAWLIRVTVNACKDYLKTYWKKNVELKSEQIEPPQSSTPENTDILQAVRQLPPLYRDAIYLHYYEGYKAKEICHIMKKSENTVYSLLSRGREQLKTILGGDTLE